ncbi:Ser/Thr protein phosphatase [Histomonas meleagridis]|uniref:Ser/Thr protein phosphatase n=1 Tax=Histomonas meleagridis TaxID=135588 RepID=UPI00355A5FDF|nr:Ser/Thr protein phosphatase [Histomonas meleagridis]KAH0802444.1 Ser/Thr protein phosphatase [Histomonas meleagridis]
MNASKINTLIKNIITNGTVNISTTDVADLCKKASEVLLKENSLLELQAPINVCGDIHGELNDLIALLQIGGFGLDTKYLFLGDYVDRGENSYEVFCLLIALKIQFPNNIFLLRGNHECEEMSENFEFAVEVGRKASPTVLPYFYEVFDSLPIAAIISDRIFCVHAGISPELTSIEQIRSIARPVCIQKSSLLADLVWSDPSSEVVEWETSPRGTSYLWGIEPAKRFLQENQLCMILRGHQVAATGVDFPFGSDLTVVTVFTSSSPLSQNVAAFLSVNEDDTMECVQLPQFHFQMSYLNDEEENGIFNSKNCQIAQC